jgi:hypothetical protein
LEKYTYLTLSLTKDDRLNQGSRVIEHAKSLDPKNQNKQVKWQETETQK